MTVRQITVKGFEEESNLMNSNLMSSVLTIKMWRECERESESEGVRERESEREGGRDLFRYRTPMALEISTKTAPNLSTNES